MTVKIVTDSTSYLPQELVETYDIDIVSLGVVFEDSSYSERNISNSFFYSKLAESHEIPTSSQPAITEFADIFSKNAREGHQTVAILISSKMSGTFNTAVMAKSMVLERQPEAVIKVIDSGSNSMQLGFAALAAAKAAKAGKSISRVIECAKENIARSRFIFVPHNLDYLKKGGRIGLASALIGNIMKIKPILTVSEGIVKVMKKVRTKKRAVKALIDTLMTDIKNYGLGDVIVHHIECEKEASELARIIGAELNQQVNTAAIGPVVGTHVGPGAIGLVYYTTDKLS